MSLKAFFSFWPSDKISILLLMASLFFLFAVPYIHDTYIYKPKSVDFTDFSNEIKEAMARIDSMEQLDNRTILENEIGEEDFFVAKDYKKKREYKAPDLNPRKFNPNTFTKADAREIGLSQFVIRNIASFRAKGYSYRSKENFLETYGLTPDQQKQLYAYVDLPTEADYQKTKAERQAQYDKKKQRSSESKNEDTEFASSKTKKPRKDIMKISVDINTADEEALQKIRGIGEVYAVEIVEFREKLGAFNSIEQIKDVPMMRDSIFQVIKNQLTISNKGIRKININQADTKTLKAHPYISYKIAKSIVAMRKQHGAFVDLNQLKKSKVISDQAFTKMRPYLRLQ